MDSQKVRQIHSKYCKPGYGTVAPDELEFIQELIGRYRPDRFIEVGMASGLSTGFIANFLDEQGGGELLSIDYDDTFFGDPSKPNGFLVPEVYKGSKVNVTLAKFKTALDAHSFDGQFHMALVDANHQHPWPCLDMMSLYSKMSGPKIMIHHDLRLYMNQDVMFGIGPKYLYDQFPESHRIKSNANNGNIFAVDLNIEKARFEELVIDLMKLPWSLRTPLQPNYVKQIRNMIQRDFSPKVLDHFERCLNNMNNPDRFRSGL